MVVGQPGKLVPVLRVVGSSPILVAKGKEKVSGEIRRKGFSKKLGALRNRRPCFYAPGGARF